MRFAARLFLVLFFLVVSFSFAARLAHAQYSNPYIQPNVDANVPANMHTYTQSLVLEILSAFTCQITGQDPLTQNHQCLGFDTTTGKIGYVPSNGGAIGFVGNMIATLYTPPIDTVGYGRYVASNFGLVKHTYAAQKDGGGDSTQNGTSVSGCTGNGCGFDKLTPILSVWTTFRNISYALFVIIFVAIGFAIMLRVQIDPRTVMTIENQIPKIIIALILVTFSYAISGFLIDMMYASTYLTINIVKSSATTSTKANIEKTETDDLTGGNPLGAANDILPGGMLGVTAGASGGVQRLVQGLFQPSNVTTDGDPGAGNSALVGLGVGAGSAVVCSIVAVATLGVGIVPCLIAGAAIGIGAGVLTSNGFDVGEITQKAVGVVISWVAAALAFLVIAIALLVALFRVWFTLLLTYVQILLDIVLSPFIIIFGIFPGSKMGFGSWFKSMVGNLLAFPVTIAMFLLAGVFADNFATNSTNMFVPPLIGNPNAAVPGAQSPIAYIIALGMVLLTPNIVQLTRGLVGAEENKALAGVFQGLGVGGKTVGGIFKRTSNAVFGNQIMYQPDGTIKTLTSPVEKLWHGFVGGAH